ncbi:MAG TPA: XRE family transcriptional regulator [Xanthobacteraceae bacterium]|jgi:Zn-dependent peptidase ImmA (M78 family)|nr:XRE family transcriptional regulator [Xanthobacteraceae bacterium]
MNSFGSYLSSDELGERLRIVREAARVTQADAAEAIKVARTTLVAMEQGQRRVRIDELQNLALLYNVSVNALLRQEAVHVDLTPRFRKLISDDDDASRAASQLLTDLAAAEVELENLLGIRWPRNYPPERPLVSPDVRRQAEHDALELRQRLGLGLAPISDLVTILELDLGVRIFVRRLHTRISGLFAYDEKLGACVLLNANHPRERRAATAAHEVGHLLCSRGQPDVLNESAPERSPEERYCNAFARNLLMPMRAVSQKFNDLTAGSARLTRRHIIVLAHYFGVSREAAVRRLEELALVMRGSWDWFEENGGITDEQARQVLGDLIVPDASKVEADRPTTLRLNMLAAEAHRRSLLSEGQLARLLHLSRVELRELLDGVEVDGSMADEAPVLSLR